MENLRSLRRNDVEPINVALLFDPEMIHAVQCGTIKQVETLLEQGANPNATDGMLDSALGLAVLYGNLEMTQLLVRYGADLNQRNPFGSTAMHPVVFSDENFAQKICSLLLDNGAEINAVGFDGWTPLMKAVHSKHFDLAKLLLERGANASLKNSDGDRALDLLRRGKGYKAVKKLLEQAS